MIDGMGDPGTTPACQPTVESLFQISYTLKHEIEKATTVDYVVTALEGSWWFEDMRTSSMTNRDEWKWTLMIMQPKEVSPRLVKEVVEPNERRTVEAQRNRDLLP